MIGRNISASRRLEEEEDLIKEGVEEEERKQAAVRAAENPEHILSKVKPNGETDILTSKELVNQIYLDVRHQLKNRRNYFKLAWFITYVALYLTILSHQRVPYESFQVEEAIKAALFSETSSTIEWSTGEIAQNMDGVAAIWGWMEQQILPIFTDPVCGDSVCTSPHEYRQWAPGHGCSDDCGVYPKSQTTRVYLNLSYTFRSDDEMSAASWNLCSSTHSVCYFHDSQTFTGELSGQIAEKKFDLPDGKWELQLYALNGGIEGSMYTIKEELSSGQSGKGTVVVREKTILVEWGLCKTDNDASLINEIVKQGKIVRQECQERTSTTLCGDEDSPCEGCRKEGPCLDQEPSCEWDDTTETCNSDSYSGSESYSGSKTDSYTERRRAQDDVERSQAVAFEPPRRMAATPQVEKPTSPYQIHQQRRLQGNEEECGNPMSECDTCHGNVEGCQKKSFCDFDFFFYECNDNDNGFSVPEECSIATSDECDYYMLYNTWCDDECNVRECGYDSGYCGDTNQMLNYTCSENCFCDMLNDGTCNPECDNIACGLDLGDCCIKVFTTNYTAQFELWNTFNSETMEPLNLASSDTRARSVASNNRILGGILLHTQRYKRETCKDSSQFHYISKEEGCRSNSLSTEPYGADPVFLRSSSLNVDPNVFMAKHNYYNMSDINQVSSLGLPYGFHYLESESSSRYSGYPVLLDVNLGQQRAREFLAYVKEGMYLDQNTKDLLVQMVTYNSEMKLFANTAINFEFEEGGRITMETIVQSFRVEQYNTANGDRRQKIEIVFVIFTTINIVMEAFELVGALCNKRGLFGRTGYLRSFWNYVDIASLCTIIYSVSIWLKFSERASEYAPQLQYDIYDSLTSRGNFLSSNDEAMRHALESFNDAGAMSDEFLLYITINGISIILLVSRTLKLLDFQPKMGLVTRTLENAAADLAHFTALFSLVFVLFAIDAYLVFGSSIEDFSTISKACHTCFYILLGEIGVVDKLFEHPSYFTAVTFYYSYLFLAYFCLLNCLLALLIESYIEVKQRAEHSQSMPAEILQLINATVKSLHPFRINDYIPDKIILEHIGESVLHNKIEEKSSVLGRRQYRTQGFIANKEQLEAMISKELSNPKQKHDTGKVIGDRDLLDFLHDLTQYKSQSKLKTQSSNPETLSRDITRNLLHRYGYGDLSNEKDLLKAISDTATKKLRANKKVSPAPADVAVRTAAIMK